jgi:hypothetical protein
MLLPMPSLATSEGDPPVPFGSAAAMGCMMLKECTEDVKRIRNAEDFETAERLQEDDWVANRAEVQVLLNELNRAGIEVFVGPGRYFMPRTRGVYKTDFNRLFLNRDYMVLPETILKVLRHEGWHAAQDCMAGTLDNTYIAIIKPMDEVPMIHREMVERTYTGPMRSAQPWEKEAHWAAAVPWMTTDALRACNGFKPMWEIYDPTPMTREWLVKEGYIK